MTGLKIHTACVVLAILVAATGPAQAGKAKPVAAQAVSDSVPIPVPRAKPRDLVPHLDAPPVLNGTGGWSAESVAAGRAECAGLLKGLDLDWKPVAPLGSPDGCGAPAPVEISRIDGVTLAPPAILTCRLAGSLHGWITGTVQPAARRDLKTEVTAIRTASSYVCRLRNSQSTGKMSEHGRANALDMAGFTFGRKEGVAVADSWGGHLQKAGLAREETFLEHIRSGACAYFTTVLGPGSDAYHGDHFHVDAIARHNGYRICQ